MNRDLAERWVEVLRSGKYRQGRLRLRTPENEYCCLGVLCDVVDPEAWSFTDDGRQVCALITMNDEAGDDFEAIANQVEEWLLP